MGDDRKGGGGSENSGLKRRMREKRVEACSKAVYEHKNYVGEHGTGDALPIYILQRK